MIECSLEGLDELKAEHSAACDELDQDLNDAAVTAAGDGVKAAQDQHPYTDRTYQLTERAGVELESFGEASMVWPKEYASFVDEGTSRNAAYPFTPIAKARAESSLDNGAELAVKKLEERMNQ